MKIKIRNVRLAFPKLWTPEAFGPGAAEKYQCTLLIDNDEEATLAMVRDTIEDVGAEQWKSWGEKKFRGGVKVRALLDGEEKSQYDGFEGCHFVNASNTKRPKIRDKDGETDLWEKDGRPYGGCYVNAILDIWAQDNKYGKAINAALLGVQFVRDGDSFGGGSTASEDDFDAIEDDDDPLS